MQNQTLNVHTNTLLIKPIILFTLVRGNLFFKDQIKLFCDSPSSGRPKRHPYEL